MLRAESSDGVGEVSLPDARCRHAVLGVDLRNGNSAERRLDDGQLAVEFDLNPHAGRTDRGRRAKLEWRAGGWPYRNPLVGLDQIRMPTPCGPVTDHLSVPSGIQTSAQVENGGSSTES